MMSEVVDCVLAFSGQDSKTCTIENTDQGMDTQLNDCILEATRPDSESHYLYGVIHCDCMTFGTA